MLITFHSLAQVGIGTTNPDNSAQLDLSSTTRGFLAPRMSQAQMNAISAPAAGLTVFNSDSSRYFVYFGSSWIRMLTAIDTVKAAHSLSDADKDTRIEVEQSTDEDKIHFIMGGKEYFQMNKGTLQFNNTAGSIYIGEGAGLNHDYTATVSGNVAVGGNSMQLNQTGSLNTAVGKHALYACTGEQNTAIGGSAGRYGAVFSYSSLLGYAAGLHSNGSNNLMLGYYAGSESSGDNNVFAGQYSGQNNLGSGNVFIGSYSGQNSDAVSNKLYIDNSNTNTPLIYGDFSLDSLRFNGSLSVVGSSVTSTTLSVKNDNVGIGLASPSYKLHISGTTNDAIYATSTSLSGTWFNLNNTSTGGNTWSFISTGINNSEGTGNLLIKDPNGVKMTVNSTTGYVGIGTTNPQRLLNLAASTGGSLTLTASSQTTDNKHWGMEVAGTALYFHIANDAYNTTTNRLTVNRSGTSVSSVAFPNGNVGIGSSSAASTMDISGTIGMKVKGALTAGTNNPDGTATTWIYTSGSGTITLPGAGSCANRMYMIVNKTLSALPVSAYVNMTNTSGQTSISPGTSLTLMSDGNYWQQVR